MELRSDNVSMRDRLRAFGGAVVLALIVFTLGPPTVQAAVSTVKIKDSGGGRIDAEPVAQMGLTDAKGSRGAVAVRTFAGGSGLLGAGDCTASTEPAQGPLPNTVTLGDGHILTRLVITGTGTVRVTTQAVGAGQLPLANFSVNAEHPNEVVNFGNGLTVTAPLTVTGIDGTACNFLLLGQGPGAG